MNKGTGDLCRTLSYKECAVKEVMEMLRSVTAVVFLIGTVLLRPAALGGTYTQLGVVVICCALLIHLVRARGVVSVTKQSAAVFLTTAVLWGYLLAHSWVTGAQHVDFTLKAALAHLVVVFAGAVVLSDRKTNVLFFRGFIWLIVASVVSFFVTILLSLFVPLDKLYLFQLTVEGGNYSGSGMTFFPFTSVYGLMQVGSKVFPRFMSWFREAGIFQAFSLWAYYSLSSYGMNHKWIKITLLLGVVAALSTAGVALVPICMAAALILGQYQGMGRPLSAGVRFGLSVTLIGFALLLAIYAPIVGFQDKSAIYAGSFTDRTEATVSGLKKFVQNPFGTGAYSQSDAPNAGINLLSASSMIGFVGVGLVLAAFFVPAKYSRVRARYLVAITPLFLTLLVSQPILDAPILYLMFMSNSETLEDLGVHEQALQEPVDLY